MRSAVALLLGAWLLVGCAAGPEPVATITDSDDDGMHGAVLVDQYAIPDVKLTDTGGAAYSLVGSTDKPLTLVFFGYTHCPDICQLVMANLASALTRIDPALRESVDVVFVTTDPARDNKIVLREYLDRFDPSFIGLTGPLDRIVEVSDAVGVYVARGRKLPGGGYEVDHGTPIVAIDERDRSPIVWTQGTSAADLAEDVTALLTKDAP